MRSVTIKGKRFIKWILILLIVCMIAFTAGFLFSMKKSSGEEITSDTLFQQMQTVSKLATLEYNYTNMGKFEDSADLNGWDIPLTKKSFILTYDGKITTGIEMEDVKVDIQGKRIEITLPQAQILNHEVDESSIELYDETKNIFNPISINDYAAFSAEQKKVMEEKTVANGLLASAQKRAENVITQLIGGNLNLEEYDLVFKTVERNNEKRKEAG